jgi:hypothetical protein
MSSTQQETAPAPTERSRWRRLLPHAAVAVPTAALTAYVSVRTPYEPGGYPVCVSYSLAGVYCPGCGLLRAAHDLTHLDVVGAMERNPIAIPLFAGMLLLFAFWVRASWRGRPLRWRVPTWLPVAIGVGLVVFTVARNIPGWSWMSPA